MSKTIFFQSCRGVFQGGGCRAAALVGAYDEAIRRGVQFTEVAGTSAGAIVAALVGAGASPEKLLGFIQKLDFRRFLMPPEITAKPALWKRVGASVCRAGEYSDVIFHQGLHSSSEIEKWMESCLRELLGPRQGPTPFSALELRTSVVATNIVNRRVQVWNQQLTPNDSVAAAVRASCSIPIFFQPVDFRYVDGGALSNLPTFIFADSNGIKPLSNRVLAFVLKADDEIIEDWNTKTFFTALADTIVEGSQNLQLNLHSDVHVIEAPTGKIKATDFDKIDASTIAQLVEQGRTASGKFFDSELQRIRTPRMPSEVCYDREQLYGLFTRNLDSAVSDVLISEIDSEFVYPLFPSLLIWRSRGVRCRVLLSTSEKRVDHGQYRRELLRRIGVEVAEVDVLPFTGYFVNGTDVYQGIAYVAIQSGGLSKKIDAVVYEGAIHSSARTALYESIARLFPSSTAIPHHQPIVVSDSQGELFKRLRKVSQYSKSGVDITFESIRVADLLSLANYVREYKYNQIRSLVGLYREKNISLFEPAAVVLTGSHKSIVTPPVVEASGSRYVLIEGSTRATFLRDQGEERIACVVVRGVRDALPSDLVDFSKVRVVARKFDAEFRYAGFNYTLFRHIEASVHPLDST